jgi:5'-nucleotidase
MMRTVLLLLMLAVPMSAETIITLLHFSDYHSHALPFYTEEGELGGIARAIGYLRAEKARGAFVFSGGDMVNKGAPAWSDLYRCEEWRWLNGVVDAMAFGNHDVDYGRETFDRCRAAVRYPILSANTAGFRRYTVLKRGATRIGVFAVAGPDFRQLVKVPGFTFSDPVAAAREVVRELRDKEKVNVVVMIGHQNTEDDYALAKAVAGIDVIFGSHSHLKRDLTRIDGTNTSFISPSQYLTYISRIEVVVEGGRVRTVRGGLMPVNDRMPAHPPIAQRVARMQRDLERHPEYAALFAPIGTLDAPLSAEPLAMRALQVMRAVTQTDVAISTASSFRQPLPAGTLTMELLRGAMPYDNEIVVCTLTGADLTRLHSGSYVSGTFNASGTYKVATTDYLAGKEKLNCERTGKRVRGELQDALSRR